MSEILTATRTKYENLQYANEVPSTSDVIIISENMAAPAPDVDDVSKVISPEEAARIEARIHYESMLSEIKAVVARLTQENARDSAVVDDPRLLAAYFMRTVEAYTVELTDPADIKAIWKLVLHTLSENDTVAVHGGESYSRIFVDCYNDRQRKKKAIAELAVKLEVDFNNIPTPSVDELNEAIKNITPDTVSPPRGVMAIQNLTQISVSPLHDDR